MTRSELTRRAFLAAVTSTAMTTLGGCATRVNTARVVPGKVSPNERLNIAAVGAGGKGRDDIRGCRSENLIALCDPDWRNAEASFAEFPNARHFRDFRVMLDSMPEIDACTVSTPDHTHAPAAYHAMMLGKHVYVQKPLTHTIAEARLLLKTARKMKVMTQMGNQGHSKDSVRELAEVLWSGAAGEVGEVHSWTDRPIWPQGLADALPQQPVPETMDWDVWIGSAPMRPYHPGYAPFNWRGWLDFGTGALGDMACHVLDVVWTSLKIGEAKHYAVEPVLQEGLTRHCYPLRTTLKFSIPARADMPPCDLYWYDGFWEKDGQKAFNRPKLPHGSGTKVQANGESNGCLFHGTKGTLATSGYGQGLRLLPEGTIPTAPLQLPRIPDEDHYRDWIRSCKDGRPACSNFEYSAPFTQMVLLGNVALRAGQRIEFHADSMRITNVPGANALLTKEYRKDHELPV